MNHNYGYGNPNIPRECRGCGQPLLLENLFVDDGCPCNTPRGVNFKPQTCKTCKGTDFEHICVKPGHRLAQLFGEFVLYIKHGKKPRKKK